MADHPLQAQTILAVLESPAGQRAIREGVDARLREVTQALFSDGQYSVGLSFQRALDAPREPAQDDDRRCRCGAWRAARLSHANDCPAAREPAQEQEGNWVLNTTTTRPALEPAQERQEAPDDTISLHDAVGLVRSMMGEPTTAPRWQDNCIEALDAVVRAYDATHDPLLPGLRAADALLAEKGWRDEGPVRAQIRAEIARREGGNG